MVRANGKEPLPQVKAGLEHAKVGWHSVVLHGITTGGVCSCGDNPCKNKPGKHPLTEHGDKDASTETRVIWDWFHRWPDANIGIVLEPSNLLDIAPDSPDWLERFQQRGLPRTAMFRSGGGEGHRHYLYQRPEGCPASRLCRSGEYDIMAAGYCVAPPSRHASGGQYEWIIPPGEFPQGLPPAPRWAVAMLQQAAEKAPKADPGTEVGDGPPVRLSRVGLAYWHGERVKEKPDGATDRSVTLYAIAGFLAEAGASERTIVDALENRDVALGFSKYTDRRDRAEYQRIAAKVVQPPGDVSHEGPELEWGPRQDLPPERPPVPTMPPWMVVAALRTWIQDVAERACAPLEMIACPAIVCLGALVGRKLGIRPSAFDDYLVAPNLWGGIIARPGFMKTHYVDQGTAHLKRLAAIALEKFELERWKWEAEQARIEAEVAAIKSRMTAAAKKGEGLDDLQREFAELKRELKDAQVVEHRYLTQDATVEKLGELLQENPDGLLVLRDELAGWLRTLDKPGREGDREFYLEGWNGTGRYTFDRIGRGTVHIPAVCLSIFGGIQPGKLNSYIHEAITESGGADGLLQRLQLTVWPDALGKWEKSEQWPDTEAKNHAFEIFEYLDRFNPVASGAHMEEGSIPFLRFTPEAQELFDDWRDELENRLRSDELVGTPAFESHIAKYRSLMPSLALLFHLVDCAAVDKAFDTFDTGVADRSHSVFSRGVPLEAARLAAAWCEFLEQHARKVYADELYPGVEAAHSLAAKIAQGVVTDGQSVRDVYNHHWSGLATSSQVSDALETLNASGWVRVEAVNTGGRPTELLRLHPDLRAGDDN